MLASSLLALFSVVASTAVAGPIKRADANQATYYAVGLGACGWTNSDSEMVVAMNAPEWNGGADCGKTVSITCTKTGNTATAKVVDLCPGCATGSLDMSPALFNQLSNNNPDWGVFPITWEFTDGTASGSGAATASGSVAATASGSAAATASGSAAATTSSTAAANAVVAAADPVDATEAVDATETAAAAAATETAASDSTTSSSNSTASSQHGHHHHHHGGWHNGNGGN